MTVGKNPICDFLNNADIFTDIFILHENYSDSLKYFFLPRVWFYSMHRPCDLMHTYHSVTNFKN